MSDVAFWARVEKTPECWVWTGDLNAKGYGRTTVNGRREIVHRYAYRSIVGSIPTGLTLDHLCHTADSTCPGGPTCLHRRCVNPSHLEPVTLRENVLRGRTTGATHCRHGHPLSGDNLRWQKGPDGALYRRCNTCHHAPTTNPKARYQGEHLPLGGGLCEHRWQNRLTRTVHCAYGDGLAAGRAEALDVERLAQALHDSGIAGCRVECPFPAGAHPSGADHDYASLLAAAYNATPERPADEVDG